MKENIDFDFRLRFLYRRILMSLLTKDFYSHDHSDDADVLEAAREFLRHLKPGLPEQTTGEKLFQLLEEANLDMTTDAAMMPCVGYDKMDLVSSIPGRAMSMFTGLDGLEHNLLFILDLCYSSRICGIFWSDDMAFNIDDHHIMASYVLENDRLDVIEETLLGLTRLGITICSVQHQKIFTSPVYDAEMVRLRTLPDEDPASYRRDDFVVSVPDGGHGVMDACTYCGEAAFSYMLYALMHEMIWYVPALDQAAMLLGILQEQGLSGHTIWIDLDRLNAIEAGHEMLEEAARITGNMLIATARDRKTIFGRPCTEVTFSDSFMERTADAGHGTGM